MPISFDTLFKQVAETANTVFADATTVQHLEKLQQEAQEAIDHPHDVEEYADCLIALLGAAAKQGISADKLITYAVNKNYLNRKVRKWAKSDNGMYQHVKS